MSDGAARPALKKQNLPVPLPKSAAVHTRLAHVLPALIAAAGEQAGWRYVEFFTANIRNPIRGAPTRAPAAGSSPGARIAGWS